MKFGICIGLLQLLSLPIRHVHGGEGGACTPHGQDPWRTGERVRCCDNLQEELRQWSAGAAWSYRCPCTGEDQDPWSGGTKVDCCDGLREQLGQWSGADWSYRCRAGVPIKLLEWNVLYSNDNLDGIADIVRMTQPDIVGLCELLTVPVEDMASALSDALGRPFQEQPGRENWVGYGTDIFFDSEKWNLLEGGAEGPSCSPGRAANWVVLEHHETSRKLIVGGTHLSYCGVHGCPALHECELGFLYSKFEAMKQTHGQDVPVLWMGDTNRANSTQIMQNLYQGRIGQNDVFNVTDLAQTQGNTYFTGGPAIDFILGEAGSFVRQSGGLTGQGTIGSHLSGADHFPVFADVQLI